jgi:hypothetical protein
MRIAIVLFMPLVALAQVRGGEKFDPAASAKLIAPFLDEDTVVVARADLSRLDPDVFVEKIAEAARDQGELEERKKEVRAWLKSFTAAGGKEMYLIYSIEDLPDAPVVVVPLGKGADATALEKLLPASTILPDVPYKKQGTFVVGADENAARRLARKRVVPRPEVARAFAAAGDGTVQIVLTPSPDHRRVFEELVPTLPAEVGGGSGAVLARGIVYAAATVRTAPKLSLHVTIQSESADAARKLQAWLVGALRALPESKVELKFLSGLARVAGTLKPKVEGDRVTLAMDEQQVVAMLRPLFGLAVQAGGRDRAVTTLKQLALALHSYADTYRHFPPFANHSKDGKPLLSWRVHILPYVEEQALYNQFKLDQPWDSPHNKKLIDKMPKIYKSPLARLKDPTKTTYLVPRARETIFPGPEGVQFRDILDGTSNTILVVEAAADQAVIWTKPDDLPVDKKQPGRGLFGKGRDEFLTAFADGSVRGIPATTPAETLWALFTRAGGEAVNLP